MKGDGGKYRYTKAIPDDDGGTSDFPILKPKHIPVLLELLLLEQLPIG